MSSVRTKQEIVSVAQHTSAVSDDSSDDSSTSSILPHSFPDVPVFMKYFAIHESIVLLSGGVYHMQPDIGVLCLSILPGASVVALFLHFLVTRFKHSKLSKSTFRSCKHYVVASCVFLMGLFSIGVIYHTNTYLSSFVPVEIKEGESSSLLVLIADFLQFPNHDSIAGQAPQHSTLPKLTKHGPFNFRVAFVGSVIAPVVEESFKFALLALAFPISFLWTFSRNNTKTASSHVQYCIQSLFVMFVGFCGASGIAIMENTGYLAACQWAVTKSYCLPNKQFDIMGAGLARGIFSVPFHCATAGIMADIVCCWLNCNIRCFNSNRCLYALKFVVAYPLSIMVPVFFHSSFNYWMKGLPIMTGAFTILGFSWFCFRISVKHAYINSHNLSKQYTDIDVTSGDAGDDYIPL